MTEDAPLHPITPEPVTEPTVEVPTEPAPAATQPGVQPWPTPPVVQDAPRPPGSSTVAVPKWLLLVVGALVIAAIGFGVGYAVAPGDDGGTASPRRPGSGFVPGPFENGGGANRQPTIPSPTPGTSRGGFLGVAVSRSTDPAGVRVVSVVPDSPAASAGLKVDDVITKLDGDTVTAPNQLATRIGAHRTGDQVTVTYVRAGSAATARVTLKLRNAFDLPTPSTTQAQS